MSEKTPGFISGSQTKGTPTGCLKGKNVVAYDRIPYPRAPGFRMGRRDAIWKDRLSELANYRKIYGHCNVPYNDKDLRLHGS
jgi:hypothetical protein